MPKVSVIVPNYNHARFLSRRVDSILRQSFQDFDLILLDDCSTDDSRSVLSASADHTVRLWRCDTWEMVAVLDEPGSARWLSGLTFHPQVLTLATIDEGEWARGSGYEDRAIRIRKMPFQELAKILFILGIGFG